MSDATHHLDDDRFEALLDGTLPEPDRAAAQRAVEANPRLMREAALDREIAESLKRLFAAEPPAAADLIERLKAAAAQAAPRSPDSPAPRRAGRWRRLAAAAFATAAALGWIAVSRPFWPAPQRAPNFAARSLPELYREAVANGFEPDYACEAASRFASTFARRQGVPLKLLELPAGTRMLGIAYPGGLSPDTTAVLAEVDGKRVMAFVDRPAADRAIAADGGDGELHVFRLQRDGLLFYEVSPLDRPRLTEFLAPASTPGASELP